MKPIFSPSKLRDFACGTRFRLRWIEKVGPRLPLSAPPTLGTLVHEGEAEVDRGGKGKVGIKRSLEEVSKSLHLSSDIPLLRQLGQEAESIVEGVPFLDGRGTRKVPESYSKWRTRNQEEEGKWEVIDVEKRFYVDVGPLILAAKLDLVIENDLGMWAVERKTRTDISDKAQWIDRFRLDVQILSQMAIVEKHYSGSTFAGAMVRAVAYSRQNKKDWSSDLPQGLSSVKRNSPVWISRKPATEALFNDYLEHVAAEHSRRILSGKFPAEGLGSEMCKLCDYRGVCRGEVPVGNLVPLPPSEIELEETRRTTTPRGGRPKGYKKKRLKATKKPKQTNPPERRKR